MRRCPYCAEDIPDDATRCPHCQSDLTTGPGAQPGQAGGYTPTVAAPAPGPTGCGTQPAGASAAGAGYSGGGGDARPVQFSHTGQRYLLGFGTDYFGIWDRSAPAQAVERFPRTDQGWAQAWTRYASIEPNSQPVQAAAPYGSPYGGQYAGGPQGPGAWGHPGAGYGVHQPTRTNGLAVAALVMGILGWIPFVPAILAIVFGAVSQGQIRRSGGAETGRGMAIAGIVLGIAWLVVYIIVLSVNPQQ